jgi:uncharacterized protein (TIRG00374 family)
MIKKYIKLGLGVGLTGAFLWLIIRQVHIEQIKNSFRHANMVLIFSSVIFFSLGYICRIERWRVMLKHENPTLKWGKCAGPMMASMAANNVLPFRAGDLIRAFGFNSRLGISAGTSVTTLFVERMLDLLMLITLFGSALGFFGMETSRFLGIGGIFLIFIAFGILSILLFPTIYKPLAFSLGEKLLRFAPKMGQKILDEIQKGFSALEHMSTGHTMAILILWSMLAWIFEGFLFWLSALALPSITHPMAAWLALPIGTLATILPSTPGYVGTFDFFTIKAMTVLGNTLGASTAYELLVHVMLWIPPTLVGGLYLLIYPIKSNKKLKVAR